MPESKHTPGPWEAIRPEAWKLDCAAYPHNLCWIIVGNEDRMEADDWEICFLSDGGKDDPPVEIDDIATEFTDANARLIAAAPDLLRDFEQLVAAAKKLEDTDLYHLLMDEVEDAELAIAKAKGEQA